MNKNLLLIVGGTAIALLLIVLVFMLSSGGGSGPGQKPVTLPDHKFEDWNAPIGDPEALRREAFSLFDQEGMLSYEDLIRAAQSGEIRLVSELWALRRRCPEELDRYECNVRIREFLLEKFLPPGNERLVELFTKYLQYEEEMTTFEMPRDLPLRKQYELIRQKRREFFGTEDAKLIFGYEEAKADFAVAYADFQEETKGMSGDQRLAKYEELRKNVYGDYYDTVVSREPKFTKYETEVDLRSADLNGLDSSQRSANIREMREKYFGKDGADRMAAVDAQIAQRDQNEADYQKAESEFLKNNAELNDEERAKKLMELRVKYFGQEEAEAYTRRENYQKAMEELRANR